MKYPDLVVEREGWCLTIISRDNEEVLFANFPSSTAARAIKSQDTALVLVAKEYIRYGLMFSELAKEVDLHRAGELWKKNPNLFVVTGKRFK
ncbi:hypothetical protein [Peribacillus sp. FSL K6-1552]|uniref:hypothetical protein n=1 Tax=Peribacillus sp. FSL K6-1552 TaxID=2954514 RepID=UPI0040469F9F